MQAQEAEKKAAEESLELHQDFYHFIINSVVPNFFPEEDLVNRRRLAEHLALTL